MNYTRHFCLSIVVQVAAAQNSPHAALTLQAGPILTDSVVHKTANKPANMQSLTADFKRQQHGRDSAVLQLVSVPSLMPRESFVCNQAAAMSKSILLQRQKVSLHLTRS